MSCFLEMTLQSFSNEVISEMRKSLTGYDKVVSGLILAGSSKFLSCVSMTLVECTQCAVLVAVQGGAPRHGIVPWVLFVRAPQLRAEGQISNGAL